MGREPPASLVFLFCERVESDDVTGQFTLVRLLDERNTSSLPAHCPGFIVYAEVVGERGPVCLVLRLVRLVASAGSASGETALPFRAWRHSAAVLHRTGEVARILFRLDGLRLPDAGAYLFGLEADGQLITARRFKVSLTRAST